MFTVLVALSYASRTAVSNVPGGSGSALRFVVSLLCQPDSGFKRALGVVIMPSDLWCRCYASLEAVSKVPASDLWCRCYASRTTASNVPMMFIIAVVLPSDLWSRCSASRTAASNVPGVLCFFLRFVVSLLCKPDTGFKRARGVVVLPADLWFRCYASPTAASNVSGVLWCYPPICSVVVMPA